MNEGENFYYFTGKYSYFEKPIIAILNNHQPHNNIYST